MHASIGTGRARPVLFGFAFGLVGSACGDGRRAMPTDVNGVGGEWGAGGRDGGSEDSDAGVGDVRFLGAKVRFASAEEGSVVLGTPDEFSAAMSAFDRGFRMKTLEPTTSEEFLAHAAEQALDWPDEQRARWLEESVRLKDALVGLDLALPDEILLVRSTGKEDIGLTYTRGSAIIVPAGGEGFFLFELIAHELFHVASRFDPTLRDRLYPLVEFTHFAPLAYPEELESRRFTNPDAPYLDCSIRIDTPNGERDVVPMIEALADLAEAPESSIFEALAEPLLLELDLERGELVTDGNGDVVRYPSTATNYESVAGVNTGYVLHAEEVVADNFSFLMERRRGSEVDLPRLDVLDAIEAELSAR